MVPDSSGRRRAREAVLQSLYALAVGGGEPRHVARTVLRSGLPNQPGSRTFGKDLFARAAAAADEYDDLIARASRNWSLQRIPLIDLTLLRMTICEFLHFPEIPPKVSINEAIEIAKRYSTSESGSFINGVLDTIAFGLRASGQMQKSGVGMEGWTEFVQQQDAKMKRRT